MRKPPRVRLALRTALRGLAAANVLALLALWALEALVAERWWPSILLTYVPQWPFAAPTALLCLLLLRRPDARALAWCAAAAAILAFPLMGLCVPLPLRIPAGVPARVVTYNVHGGRAGAGAVAAAIAAQRPSLFCLQEAMPPSRGASLLPALRAALPGYRYVGHESLLIGSRLPVRGHQVRVIGRAGARRAALVARLDVKGRPLTVVNVHFATGATAETLLRRRGAPRAYLEQTAAVRGQQVDNLMALCRDVGTPLVVCGDLNTPPRGILYRRLTRQLDDAFSSAGVGFGWTYPAAWPMLRIDHILAGPGVAVRSARVPRVRASDHRPVVADLVVTGS